MFLLLNKDTKKTINLKEKLSKKHSLTNCQPNGSYQNGNTEQRGKKIKEHRKQVKKN